MLEAAITVGQDIDRCRQTCHREAGIVERILHVWISKYLGLSRVAHEDAEAERVRRYAPKGRLFDDDEDDDEGTQMYDTDDLDYDDEDNGYDKKSKKRGRYADDDETSEDDVMAERIIHLAPPITAIACALIVALSLVYHFVLA